MRRSLTGPRLLALAGLVVAGLAMGCAHKVKIVTTPPGAAISVDGVAIGTSPVVYAEGVLPGEHRVEARKVGYRTAQVVVERSDTNWWWVAGGLAGCALCYPVGCLSGAALANLALCPACVSCLSLNVGPALTILTAPSLLTVPLVSLGALLGTTPLGLLAFSTQSPAVVKIELQEQ
ncbi:MAG: PEGA domain-containing protein [Deltaproteobacteria bacterium]|nr:PEGA domain-containing protein [Deltaproteobacteria bacterium]